MQFRNLLKLTMGFVAGGVMLATSLQAAPLPPVSFDKAPISTGVKLEPAVVSQEAVDQMKPQQVRWHRGHRHWHHRHWGWRHHHWHHHHWRHHRHW
jgi:hypothetical protein